MELLLASGTNLDVALDECSKIFDNKFLSRIIFNAKNDVVEVKDFIFSLKNEEVLPDIFIQLISSGYKSGNLAKMFKIPYIFWGENSAREYGGSKKDLKLIRLNEKWIRKYGINFGTKPEPKTVTDQKCIESARRLLHPITENLLMF